MVYERLENLMSKPQAGKFEQALRITLNLLQQEGLADWRVEFDHSLHRHGRCNHRDKVVSLTCEFVRLNSLEHIREVALHEVAHAAVGIGHGHDDVFRAKVKAMGGTFTAAKTDCCKMPEPTHLWVCDKCGYELKTHTKQERIDFAKHTKCGGYFRYKGEPGVELPSRVSDLMKLAKGKVPNFRVLNKSELIEVLTPGCSPERVAEVVGQAVARWKKGWGKSTDGWRPPAQ